MENKVIFVDFDDTICLHRFENKIDEFVFDNVESASEHLFSNCELNHFLVDYLLQDS